MIRAIAAVMLVGLTLVGLAACVRHIELHPDAPPPDARIGDGGFADGFVGDGGASDVVPSD